MELLGRQVERGEGGWSFKSLSLILILLNWLLGEEEETEDKDQTDSLDYFMEKGD